MKIRNAIFLTVLSALALSIQAENLAVITLQKQSILNEVQIDGKVEAIHQSTVSAETTGRVQQILVDVGDEVLAGAVIVKLVSNEQQQGYQQSLAAFTEAQASYDVQNKAFKRIDEVYKKQLIAKSEYDNALGNLTSAKARMESAKAASKTAEERLSYTVVKAPFAGVVSSRFVELGEAIQPGTPLMSGFDAKSLRVVSYIPQSLVAILQQQKKARIIVGNSNSITPNHIDIFPTVDAASGTVTARFTLPIQEHSIMPGTWVKVAIAGKTQDKIFIPVTAISKRSELSAIYIKTPLGPVLRQVRLGRVNDNKQIELLSGADAGEVIYIDALAAAISAAQNKIKMELN